MRYFLFLMLVLLGAPAFAQGQGSCGGPGQAVCQVAGTVTTTPAATTYQGVIALPAATSIALTAANVTTYGAMTTGTLPAPGAFTSLRIIAPSGCSFTVNWNGGTATATSGEQMGAGTNIGSDGTNLTGFSNAPTLFSTAGCASPNLIQFRNGS